MLTSRTLKGNTIYEQLNPCFRMVDFSDSSAVVTVSYYLRLAWNFIPNSTYSCDEAGIGRFMRETQAESQRLETEAAALDSSVAGEEDEASSSSDVVGKDEDVEREEKENGEQEDEISVTEGEITVNAEEKVEGQQDHKEPYTLNDWQLAVLTFWNHVYWDVMQFLTQVGMGIGHFHPPSHSSFSIPFPISTTRPSPVPTSNPDTTTILNPETETIQEPAQEPVLKNTFITNTLLIPAYLSPGTTLRMTTPSNTPNTSALEILGTFSATSKTDIWWLRQGVEVSFYLDIDPLSSAPKDNVAAVLAIGVLCDAIHEETVEAIEGEEMQQEILQAEVDIQIEEPVLEVH